MGQKDLAEKMLFSYNDVFSEVWNRFFLEEEFWIKPENLRDGPEEDWMLAGETMHMVLRDISKEYCQSDIRLIMLGFENQTDVDSKMVLRVMGYDYTRYWRQLREMHDGGSGQKMVPVVTCVLFFGYNKRWTGPKTIRDLVDCPPGFEGIVVDYKIHVIELAWLPARIRSKLTGDLRIIAEALHDLRKKGHIVGMNQELRHIDEVFRLLKAITNNDDFELPDYTSIPEGERTMANLMQAYHDKLRNEGMRAGLKEGMREGKIAGLKEGKIAGLKEGKIAGLKEGKIAGLKEGKREGLRKVAKNMLALGMEIGLIRKATRLSLEEIRGIQSEMEEGKA